MTLLENQHFNAVTVTLDGYSFVRCRLTNCELRYSGGSFEMRATEVDNCRWAFGGPARRTMEVLAKFRVSEDDSVMEDPELHTSRHVVLAN